MKKILRITMLLLVCMFLVGVSEVDAQYGKKKKKKKKKETTEQSDEDYFDESGGFKHKLWYGGMVNFNFGYNSGLGVNQLTFGLTPSVGFKINDIFSIGPRAVLNQIILYVPGSNPKILNYGIGAFGRAKIFNAVFAHTEYSFEGFTQTGGPELNLVYDNGANFYIGGGYNSSAGQGGLGYEILILYNVLENNEFVVPIEYRVGFTWNF